MIEQAFYLSDDSNLDLAEELTGLAIDEIEVIVGRFTKTSHRSGSLRGELIVYVDGSTAIRHHFNKKILWSSDGGIND